MDPPSVHLSLLGGFRLTIGIEELVLPLNTQRLLCFLALADHPLRRTFVSGSLWGDSTDEHAAGSLRSALHRLQYPTHRLLTLTAETVELSDVVSVDLRASEALARRLLDPSQKIDDVSDIDEQSLANDLLPDWTEDWVLIEREAYHQLRLRALEALCQKLTEAGRFGQAVQAGIMAIGAEQLRESSRRAVIEAHIADGNYAAAVREYLTYRDLLRAEIGVGPSSKIRALIESIR